MHDVTPSLPESRLAGLPQSSCTSVAPPHAVQENALVDFVLNACRNPDPNPGAPIRYLGLAVAARPPSATLPQLITRPSLTNPTREPKNPRTSQSPQQLHMRNASKCRERRTALGRSSTQAMLIIVHPECSWVLRLPPQQEQKTPLQHNSRTRKESS